MIQFAHEEGILVAGICTGMRVLAFADILENSLSESFPFKDSIAGFGGGTGYGPDYAPNEEFCEQIKEDIETANQANFIFGVFLVSLILVAYISVVKTSKKTI